MSIVYIYTIARCITLLHAILTTGNGLRNQNENDIQLKRMPLQIAIHEPSENRWGLKIRILSPIQWSFFYNYKHHKEGFVSALNDDVILRIFTDHLADHSFERASTGQHLLVSNSILGVDGPSLDSAINMTENTYARSSVKLYDFR